MHGQYNIKSSNENLIVNLKKMRDLTNNPVCTKFAKELNLEFGIQLQIDNIKKALNKFKIATEDEKKILGEQVKITDELLDQIRKKIGARMGGQNIFDELFTNLPLTTTERITGDEDEIGSEIKARDSILSPSNEDIDKKTEGNQNIPLKNTNSRLINDVISQLLTFNSRIENLIEANFLLSFDNLKFTSDFWEILDRMKYNTTLKQNDEIKQSIETCINTMKKWIDTIKKANTEGADINVFITMISVKLEEYLNCFDDLNKVVAIDNPLKDDWVKLKDVDVNSNDSDTVKSLKAAKAYLEIDKLKRHIIENINVCYQLVENAKSESWMNDLKGVLKQCSFILSHENLDYDSLKKRMDKCNSILPTRQNKEKSSIHDTLERCIQSCNVTIKDNLAKKQRLKEEIDTCIKLITPGELIKQNPDFYLNKELISDLKKIFSYFPAIADKFNALKKGTNSATNLLMKDITLSDIQVHWLDYYGRILTASPPTEIEKLNNFINDVIEKSEKLLNSHNPNKCIKTSDLTSYYVPRGSHDYSKLPELNIDENKLGIEGKKIKETFNDVQKLMQHLEPRLRKNEEYNYVDSIIFIKKASAKLIKLLRKFEREKLQKNIRVISHVYQKPKETDKEKTCDFTRRKIVYARERISSYRNCISSVLSSKDFKVDSDPDKLKRKILKYYDACFCLIDSYLTDIQNQDDDSRFENPSYISSNVHMKMPIWRIKNNKPYINYSDVKQGHIGDCWLEATLLSMVTYSPEAIIKAFVNRSYEIGIGHDNYNESTDGEGLREYIKTPCVTIRLYPCEGKFNYIPLGNHVDIEVSSTQLRKSLGDAMWNSSNVLWQHIIEKAFETYFEKCDPTKGKGKCRRIQSGCSSLAATLLTGIPHRSTTLPSTINGTLYLLLKSTQQKKPMQCATIDFKHDKRLGLNGESMLDLNPLDGKTERYLVEMGFVKGIFCKKHHYVIL